MSTDKRLHSSGSIMLRVLKDEDTDPAIIEEREFTLESPGIEGYILGRSDAGSSYVPDVDLADFNAQQRGISRRHAALVRWQGTVHVIDLGSMNGTFINDKRLSPQIACPLHIGDTLSLANLHLEVSKPVGEPD